MVRRPGAARPKKRQPRNMLVLQANLVAAVVKMSRVVLSSQASRTPARLCGQVRKVKGNGGNRQRRGNGALRVHRFSLLGLCRGTLKKKHGAHICVNCTVSHFHNDRAGQNKPIWACSSKLVSRLSQQTLLQ